MKVKVKVARNPHTYDFVTGAVYEALFQENKDLRVREGHLTDDLTCANKRIKALEQQLAEAIASAGTLAQKLIAANDETHKAIDEASCLNLELMDREERVTQLEQQLNQKKNELKGAEITIAALEQQLCSTEEQRDRWKKTAGENIELAASIQRDMDAVTAEMSQENEELQTRLQCMTDKYKQKCQRVDDLLEQIHELEDEYNDLDLDYKELQKTKNDYGEEIGRLRKVVTDLQTHRFTLDEIFRMLGVTLAEMQDPSSDK